MPDLSDQINKVYDASNKLITSSSTQAAVDIQSGNYKAATDTLHHMFDGIDAKNAIISPTIRQRPKNFHQILGTDAHSPAITASSKTLVPAGVGKGKMAAIVAGVGVLAGGILLYRSIQPKKQQSWTGRVEQELAVSHSSYPLR